MSIVGLLRRGLMFRTQPGSADASGLDGQRGVAIAGAYAARPPRGRVQASAFRARTSAAVLGGLARSAEAAKSFKRHDADGGERVVLSAGPASSKL
jgi:hypothetical protein